MLKCIMPTCGKTREANARHAICTCGNMMLPVAKKKEVKKPREEKDGSGD